MRYYNNEDKEQAAKNEIEFYRTAASLYAPIKRGLEKMNGKIINVRLKRALQDEVNAVLGINTAEDGRRWPKMSISYERRPGYLTVYAYHEGQTITLADCQIGAEEKRLDAAPLIESARQHREERLRRAADMEATIEKIESIKFQIEQIGKLLEGVQKQGDSEILDIYGLRYHLQRY